MYTALGLASTPDRKGVESVYLETDGEQIKYFGQKGYRPYTKEEYEVIQTAYAHAQGFFVLKTETYPPPEVMIERAAHCVTRAYLELTESFLKENALSGEDIDVIGVHGQTLYHAPQHHISFQIGDPQTLADHLGIKVVSHFRDADIRNGGQGAPLSPVFYHALVKQHPVHSPLIFLNSRNVTSLVWIGGKDDKAAENPAKNLCAFDAGPGINLCHKLMTERLGRNVEFSAHLAQEGAVKFSALTSLMEQIEKFLTLPPPKSFDPTYISLTPLEKLTTQDALATLIAALCRCVTKAWGHFPKKPRSLILLNQSPMARLFLEALSRIIEDDPYRCTVIHDPALPLTDTQTKAAVFAYLAVRYLTQRPFSFPMTTGVPKPLCSGEIFYPAQTHDTRFARTMGRSKDKGERDKVRAK